MWSINRFSEVPVYEQLIRYVERDVLCGILTSGMPTPSIRELSALLGVNPNTIQKAYLELVHREVVVASPGNGYYVASTALNQVRARVHGELTICARLPPS